MKHTFLLLIAFFAVNAVKAQTWTLDPSFGSGGITHATVSNSSSFGYAAAIQSDGKIIVVGKTKITSDYQASCMRFNTDGSVDNSFGNGGEVIIPQIATDFLLDVSIQPDGKIVAGGSSYGVMGNDIIVTRLNTDGSFDNSFSSDGLAIIDFSFGNDLAESLIIQSDGKIVLGGYCNDDFSVVRLNSDGSLDNSFGTGGRTKTEFDNLGSYILGISKQSDGKIVAGGFIMNEVGYAKFATARYDANGIPDSTYGINGTMRYDIGFAHDFCTALCIQNDDKILLGGHKYVGQGQKYDFAVLRLQTNGIQDSTFGVNGVATARIVDGENYVNDILLDANGKIILAGSTIDNSNYDFGVARFNSDGSPDLSFNSTGNINTDISGWEDYCEAALLQPDGKIVLTGRSYSNTSTAFSEFVAVRYSIETVGIIEDKINMVSIRPNPATDHIIVETTTNCTIEIYNTQGKTILSSVVEKNAVVDVSDYPKGLYFIKAATDGENQVIKLIVD